MKVAIISINKPSFESALKLSEVMSDFEVTIFAKEGFDSQKAKISHFQKLDDALRVAWREFDAIVAILATGAVIRKVAPLLQDKTKDPAILVVNLALDKIIPLLGGHLGGANSLSHTLAKRLNAIEFITTATDQTKVIAFDLVAKERGWRIENIKNLANVSNRLLNKKSVKVATTKSIFDSLPSKRDLTLIGFDEIDSNSVVIYPAREFESLTLRPKISIGVGCNKDTKKDELKEAFFEFISKNGIKLDDIEGFYSFEAKSKESGLLEFVKELDREIKFFKKEQINSLTQNFSPSASKKFFGLKGVAEPTALLGSKYKDLIIKKEPFFGKITFAGAV